MRPSRFSLSGLSRTFSLTLSLTVLLASSVLSPTTAATPPPPSVQSLMAAMNKANAAVVGIKVRAIDGARSIQNLGRERTGSGVVIGSDGLILTIGYLMLEAQQIEIITQNNKTVPATPVAYDIATGFGLLRPLLPLRGIAPVTLGSLQDLKPGEPLMAATGATADGDEADVSMTQLVSKRSFSGNWEYHIDAALFTSPPITAGGGNHSGAPLFNSRGELVGIGSLLVGDATGQAEGGRRMPGNMFVPTDLLKPILAEMRQSGSSSKSHRPWLGLTSSDQGGQVRIMRVSAESPADEAGLQAGHIVQAVDGAEVTTLESFYKKLWARANPDDTVKLTIKRGDEVKTIELKPQDRMLTLKKPSGI